jgi:hypothetical protein
MFYDGESQAGFGSKNSAVETVPTPTEIPSNFALFGKQDDLMPIKPGSIGAGENAQKIQSHGSGSGKRVCRKPAMTVIFPPIMEGVNPASFLNENQRDRQYGTVVALRDRVQAGDTVTLT